MHICPVELTLLRSLTKVAGSTQDKSPELCRSAGITIGAESQTWNFFRIIWKCLTFWDPKHVLWNISFESRRNLPLKIHQPLFNMGVSILTLAVLNAEILQWPQPFIECFRFAPFFSPKQTMGCSLSFPRRLAAKKSCHELNHLQGITELFEAREIHHRSVGIGWWELVETRWNMYINIHIYIYSWYTPSNSGSADV